MCRFWSLNQIPLSVLHWERHSRLQEFEWSPLPPAFWSGWVSANKHVRSASLLSSPHSTCKAAGVRHTVTKPALFLASDLWDHRDTKSHQSCAVYMCLSSGILNNNISINNNDNKDVGNANSEYYISGYTAHSGSPPS